MPEHRPDRPYPVPPPPNVVDREDDEMSVDEMILNTVDGQGGSMDNDRGDRDDDGDPSSPDFPRSRKRSHHGQNQAHQRHSTSQRYNSNSLSPTLQRTPHPPETSQHQNPSQWPVEEQVYEQQQQPQHHLPTQFVSDSRSSSAPHLGGNASNFASYNSATNKSRNNSNQHGQMRILSTHRAPQPLDGGAIPGSVGRASPSVMPVTGANEAAPGAENQVNTAGISNIKLN